MDWINKNKYNFGKRMSGRPAKQLKLVGVIFVVLFAVVVIIAIFPKWKYYASAWGWVGSLFSPIPFYSDTTPYDYRFVRFLTYLVGTIFISGVAIATITNMIRAAGERYLNGTASYRFKGHILFLGYDELMIGTLKHELNKDNKVDVVIAVPENVAAIRNVVYRYLSTDQAKRTILIQSSRVNVDDLRKQLQVLKAKKIFIIGQPDEETHDAINLKCLGLIASLNPIDESGEPTPCMYYLRNQSTFYLMHRLNYEAGNFRKDIESLNPPYHKDIVKKFVNASEPFNFHESMARHILYGSGEQDMDTLQLNASMGDPHLIIYGMTPMGVALMRDVMMTQHFPDRRLHITMVDKNAREEMHYLIGRHRPFFENCHYWFKDFEKSALDYDHAAVLNFIDVDVEFIQCDMAHPQMAEYLRDCLKKDGESLTIAICTKDSPMNMALALYMPRSVFESKIPIWVYQTGDSSMNAFVEIDDKKNLYSTIRVFSPMNYGVHDRRISWQWQLAKAVSDDYAEKHPYDKNYKWEYSQPNGRWSSLYGAISKISMMRSIGKAHTPILLTQKEEECLAAVEHNRWNVEKLLNGWEPAPMNTGKTLFSHDKIVPFASLDEETKIKDFEQIEAVVKKLNQKGKEYNH